METLQLPPAAPTADVRRLAWQIRAWLNEPGMRVYRVGIERFSIRVVDVRTRDGQLETREPGATVWHQATADDQFYQTI